MIHLPVNVHPRYRSPERSRSGRHLSTTAISAISTINPSKVTTTIISYEEQMRGWLSYLAKAKTIEQQVNGYNQLKRQLANYCTIPVLEFDEAAAQKFHHLKQQYPRLGSMDLKIAAIASVQGAILLTRNSRDFSQITGLSIEDWT